MSTAQDELSLARRRIALAYDPKLLEAAGHHLADALAAHLSGAEQAAGVVLPWVDPPENIGVATEMLHGSNNDHPTASVRDTTDGSPTDGLIFAANENIEPIAERFAELVRCSLGRGLNLHDPRYIGHQVPAPVPIAGLFDAIGSVTNQVMAIYEMGPWSTAVEQAMIRELGTVIGWQPDTFAGTVTHGGSLANLTGLLTARNAALGDVWEKGLGRGGPPPVLLANADAHYSVARAAGILGLGSRQIVRVGLDDRGRMDPRQLDAELQQLRSEGRPIVAVAAGACATPIGAFDPLHDIADVCQRHAVWLHVDAAHGGAAALSSRHRHLVSGLQRADSVSMDAHKMLFVPALCAFVFYRDKSHRFEAFRQDAPYLFDPAAPGLAEYDSGMKTVECTKRAAAFGLWGVWSLFGKQLFADLVDVTFAMGHVFYEKLAAAEDFQPLHEPECNIVVFRHIPPGMHAASPDRLGTFQLDLRRRLIESGEFYIVPIKRDGVGALRVTIMNPLTTPDRLEQLMDALRRHGRALLDAS